MNKNDIPTKPPSKKPSKKHQGSAIIEFAFILPVFILLIFGIFEFGRIFYLFNTIQEVTRRAAREQVVNYASSANQIRTNAIFGGTHLPAGAEISSAEILIGFYPNFGAADSDTSEDLEDSIPISKLDPANQIKTCGPDGNSGDPECAKFVKTLIKNVEYDPMIGLFEGSQISWLEFANLRITLPPSTVIMPTESLGNLR